VAKRVLWIIAVALFLTIIAVIQFVPSPDSEVKPPERALPERTEG
tara:strand:+ start:483 stop:617 length:135 start_codon:yes stop_codon:yes gene_type:complete